MEANVSKVGQLVIEKMKKSAFVGGRYPFVGGGNTFVGGSNEILGCRSGFLKNFLETILLS